jgi:hypothetical protein
MPIEIKELVIKSSFEDTDKVKKVNNNDMADIKEAIIAECVDKVLEILKEKQER